MKPDCVIHPTRGGCVLRDNCDVCHKEKPTTMIKSRVGDMHLCIDCMNFATAGIMEKRRNEKT